MSVAALQRQWLQRLERLSERPILAQTHKEAPWLPWRFYDPNAVLWTRSLLENELLFETDNPEPAVNAANAQRLAFAATLLGAKPLVADGGGKSWHVHVWIDPDVEIDPDVFDAAQKHGVDIWKTVRVTLYDAVVALAALPRGARLDRAKVAWSADRLGSMVREFGTPGSTGRPKTLSGGAMFPDSDPPLWRPGSELIAKVESALKRATTKTVRQAELSPKTGDFYAHPCVAKALSVGAPAGERNATGLHLINLARCEGLTLSEADAMLVKYLSASGLSSDDKLRGRAASLYASPLSAIACPNPLALSVCDSVAVCPKRAMRMGT